MKTENDTPFIDNFDTLYQRIINSETVEDNFYIADHNNPNCIFSDLLVQCLIRNINGNSIPFLAIRKITLKEQYRSDGLFTLFLDKLEKLHYNILFHDTINKNFANYFKTRGYIKYQEIKYGIEVDSYYKLKLRTNYVDCYF